MSPPVKADDVVLLSALEALDEAIVIFDENDVFVLCNEANRRLYPHLGPLFKEGVTLREIITGALETGQVVLDERVKENYVEERLKQHWVPYHEVEQQLDDGRWLLVRNRRLENGLFIGIAADAILAGEDGMRILRRS